jgi:hypothetical protein
MHGLQPAFPLQIQMHRISLSPMVERKRAIRTVYKLSDLLTPATSFLITTIMLSKSSDD